MEGMVNEELKYQVNLPGGYVVEKMVDIFAKKRNERQNQLH